MTRETRRQDVVTLILMRAFALLGLVLLGCSDDPTGTPAGVAPGFSSGGSSGQAGAAGSPALVGGQGGEAGQAQAGAAGSPVVTAGAGGVAGQGGAAAGQGGATTEMGGGGQAGQPPAGGGGQAPTVCPPGNALDCPCPAGQKGESVCVADGSGYGACECKLECGGIQAGETKEGARSTDFPDVTIYPGKAAWLFNEDAEALQTATVTATPKTTPTGLGQVCVGYVCSSGGEGVTGCATGTPSTVEGLSMCCTTKGLAATAKVACSSPGPAKYYARVVAESAGCLKAYVTFSRTAKLRPQPVQVRRLFQA